MKNSLFFLSLILASSFIYSQTANVTLKVKGIAEVKGFMSVALYDNAEDFPGKENYIIGEDVPVISESFEYVMKDLPYGTYAVAIYYDMDENGKMNKNWVGMPKEPFGFSNDAKGRMGPPDFEDASFEVKQDMEVVIHLIEL